MSNIGARSSERVRSLKHVANKIELPTGGGNLRTTIDSISCGQSIKRDIRLHIAWVLKLLAKQMGADNDSCQYNTPAQQ